MELRKIKIVSPHLIDQQIEIRFELFDGVKKKTDEVNVRAEIWTVKPR